MASEAQSKYIAGLAVIKTKEFKEVKEMLVASDIVKDSSETVLQAESISEITGALDDSQASRFIDLLVAAKTPVRDRVYSQRRTAQTIAALDDIKRTIDDWDF